MFYSWNGRFLYRHLRRISDIVAQWPFIRPLIISERLNEMTEGPRISGAVVPYKIEEDLVCTFDSRTQNLGIC